MSKKPKKLLPWREQGAAEQRALAMALAARKPATILEFYSPNCTLCRSLLPTVLHVESENSCWLNVVLADVENKLWLPEVKSPSLNQTLKTLQAAEDSKSAQTSK
jgi:thiol-disulfide isomerase/thioredoxin